MKRQRKKILKLSVLSLIMAMVLAATPVKVGATGNPTLIVNGVKVTDVTQGQTITCGSGTAVYDAKTTTLTLTDAEITQTDTSNQGGIFSQNFDGPLNIVLKGKNSIISPNAGSDIYVGIHTVKQGLNISGNGELVIKTKGSNTTSSTGIIIGGFLNVSNAKLTFENLTSVRSLPIQYIDRAISSGAVFIKNASITSAKYDSLLAANASVEIADSQIDISDNNDSEGGLVYAEGIEVNSGQLNIINSKINVNTPERNAILCNGDITISKDSIITTESKLIGIYTTGNLTINNSKVNARSLEHNPIHSVKNVTVSKNSEIKTNSRYDGIYTSGNLTIDKSKINATSTESNSIYSSQNVLISQSEVTTNSYFSGIKAIGKLTIDKSATDTISTNEYGLFSKNSIDLAESDVHAKGGPNKPAIMVRVVKVNDEVSSAKIDLDSHCEDKSAKIAFTDWFEKGTETRSVTSFIDKDDTELKTDLSNVLREVTIKMKSADYTKVDEAITKIPADLSQYTDESVKVLNNAKDAVVRDKLINDQTIVDQYAIAIENAIKGLKLKSGISIENKPEIINGSNQVIEKGKEATFTSDADFKDFQKVLIDGKEISSDNYSVKEGSTIVTLKASYVKTLSEGKHTISIVSRNGQANTEFTVTKGSTLAPITGDSSYELTQLGILSISSVLILRTFMKRKELQD